MINKSCKIYFQSRQNDLCELQLKGSPYDISVEGAYLSYWGWLRVPLNFFQVNHAGMQGSIQRAQCLSIRPRTLADDYGVYVSRDRPDECSTLGTGFEGNQRHRFTNLLGVDQGRHLMFLGLKPPNCLRRFVIHHEFMHVLGFDHEHQR